MGKDEAAQAYGNAQGPDPGPGWRTRAVTVAGRPIRVIAIGIAVALLVLIGGAVGVYAYDSAHKDQIADGVTVGGVDVGGLDREQAARRMHRRLVAPLQRPLKVKLGSERYNLLARQAEDPRRRRRDGRRGDRRQPVVAAFPGRVFRYVTGGSVDDTIEPRGQLLAAGGAPLRRPRRRRRSTASRRTHRSAPTGVLAERGPGRERARAEGRQASGAASRRRSTTAAATSWSTPTSWSQSREVSTNEVASEYPVYLTLDRAAYTLRLWKDLKLAKSYTVAVGQVGLETPEG